MPLEIIVLMVVLGVGAIVLAVRRSGLSRPFRIEGADLARQAFEERYPGRRVIAVLVTADRNAAFLRLDDRCTGLVEALGARYFCRAVAPGEARIVWRDGQGGAVIAYRDFTHPRGRYRLEGAAALARLEAWLEGSADD